MIIKLQSKIVSVVLLLFCLGFSFSQTNERALDSLKKVPIAINIVDIISEGQEITNDLKIIGRKAQPNIELKLIDSLYNGYKDFLLEEAKTRQNFMTINPNSQKVDNRIKKWGSYRSKLENWQIIINAYNNANSTLINDLNHKLETWNLTYTGAIDKKAPDEILIFVKNTKDSIAHTSELITGITTKYLRLQTKIASLYDMVNENRRALQQFKKSDQYGILFKRHNVIWSPKDLDYDTNDDGKSGIKSYGSAFIDFYENLISRPDLILKYFIYVILIFLTLRYCKRTFDLYPLDQQHERLRRFENMLTHQGSLIFIFLILILIRYQLLGNERIFIDIIVISSMLVAVPIIRPHEPNFFKGFFYLLTFLYITDAFKTYAWFSSLDYRIYLFAELLFIGFIIAKYTKPLFHKTKHPNQEGFSKLVQLLRPFLLLLITLGVLANIFGYTNFSDLVLIITIQSGIVSSIAYAFLKIVESIAISIIYRHYKATSINQIEKQLLVERQTIRFTKIIVFVLWALIFLNIIGQLEEFYEYLELIFSVSYTVGEISFTLGSIISFFIVLFISYLLSKLVSFLINDDHGILHPLNLNKGVPTAISLIIRYAIIGFGFIFALSILGIDLSTFNLMAGALGLGIGFGLQTIISNFVSGLILIFERPILPGDSVEFNNLWGTVTKIGVRASVVNTYDGAEVIVPNNNLITNDLINWTHSSKIRRMQILVGTSYSSDPNLVLELMNKAAIDHPLVLNDPEPQALFMEFGESSLNFSLRYWVYFENGFSSKSDISIAIYNAFKEAQIEIPFPQRDLHIKSNSTENKQLNIDNDVSD